VCGDGRAGALFAPARGVVVGEVTWVSP
jgi:hypothetical protein